MSPSPFSLDSVLNFRKRQENLAQEQFVQARIAEESAVKNLENAEIEQGNLIRELDAEQKKGLFVQDLARFEDRIQYGKKQIQLLKKTLQEKNKVTQRKRQRLIEKSREFKTLDSLKEQQNKTWKDYLEKQEAAMLDEIAILHHDRKAN
ncbi:MAG TPA: flagellar export protein FliJ [Desulfocapsa sulfexigens]|nr:flagellar export protein FliJ [Desulfocapsa sulfexigens]